MILTGDEPAHWHYTDANGEVKHALGDPRKDGGPKSQWDAATRRYAAHLDASDAIFDPEQVTPVDWDLPVTAAMFDDIAGAEARIRKLRMVIVAIRQAQQQGKTAAEIAAMFTRPGKESDRAAADRQNRWTLTLADPTGELSDADREHIADLIRDGYTEASSCPTLTAEAKERTARDTHRTWLRPQPRAAQRCDRRVGRPSHRHGRGWTRYTISSRRSGRVRR
jgi:hypothetical protein